VAVPKPLQEKVAIVTGAGRGIGRAIALRLAAEGCKVVVATRTASFGEETVRAISADGGMASLFPLDVTDKAAVAALVKDTLRRYGGVDILVHAAADIPFGNIVSLSDEDFDLCFTSIVKSAFWLARELAPHLAKEKGGRIVFVSSVNGNWTTIKGLTHYGAAKAALNAFARGAAVEFGPQGITVNTVDPGLISSDRMKAVLNPEQVARRTAQNPVARAGTPEEVASAVFHLVLPESAYINGAHLVVDGGATL
jgi:3-oxoacyl-[acyl-carrier protein] reductase